MPIESEKLDLKTILKPESFGFNKNDSKTYHNESVSSEDGGGTYDYYNNKYNKKTISGPDQKKDYVRLKKISQKSIAPVDQNLQKPLRSNWPKSQQPLNPNLKPNQTRQTPLEPLRLITPKKSNENNTPIRPYAPENNVPQKKQSQQNSQKNSKESRKKDSNAPVPHEVSSQAPELEKKIDIPKEDATRFLETMEEEQPGIEAILKKGFAPQLSLVPMTNIGFILINCIPGGQIIGIALLGSIMKILPKFPKLKEEVTNRVPDEIFDVYEKDTSKHIGDYNPGGNLGRADDQQTIGRADDQQIIGRADDQQIIGRADDQQTIGETAHQTKLAKNRANKQQSVNVGLL